MFARLTAKKRLATQAAALYADCAARARDPGLFTTHHIPDTLDGRFDALVLHVCLLTESLTPKHPALAQAVQEVFVADMDRGLREMGVGDTGVGKRVQRMAEALLGRAHAYRGGATAEALAEALHRNVYRAAPEAHAHATQLAAYALLQREALHKGQWKD